MPGRRRTEPNETLRSFRDVFVLLMLLVAAVGSATGYQELSPDATKEFEGHEYFVGSGLSFEFSGGVFRYIVDESRSSRRRTHLQESISGSYRLRSVHGYTVATVSFPSWEADIFVFWHGHHVVLFDSERDLTLIGTRLVGDRRYVYPAFRAAATSEFQHTSAGKTMHFPASNLADNDLATPWVEGTDGYGVGTVLRFRRFPVPFSSFLMINGLFSPSEPSVYSQNGRVKRVRIRAFDELGRLIFEGPRDVVDTPALQRVDFGSPAHGIDIEILEVYEGTAFEDTVITGVYFDALAYLEDEVSGWR